MGDYDYTIYAPSSLVKDMDEMDRPREKAKARGFEALTDAEVMAILFSTGIKGKGVVQMCEEILADNGNHLSLLARKKLNDMVGVYKGIGEAKALTLLAALDLGRRAADDAQMLLKTEPIRSAVDAYNVMKHHFMWLDQEEFWVLYLNRGGKPIKELKVSIGTTSFTTADVKVIVKNALNMMANSIILYHNHPSGQLRPSPEDDRLTKRISQATELFDIRVSDHLIITDAGYYSYADQGRL